ncbi:MAG TPA: S41 family peptidase [Candidatus Megaira endosymbiont of Hartmannula sinica]|nr:S41 family peptidase [Candidatus Megaera endosymbiont of Hartmannula sinica]
MTDEAINSMLRSLDPYSGYYTDDDLELFESSTKGSFGGIGIEITYENGAVKVVTPIDDLPAYNAGIEAGDYIVGINGKLVSNIGFNKAVKEMRGKIGTKLNLLVVKEKDNSTKELELVRDTVKIKPVKTYVEHSDFGDIAYIRLVKFQEDSFVSLKKAINKISQDANNNNRKITGIILDLRNNPGGLLNQAIDIVEYFIDSGSIVSVKGRNQESIVKNASRFAVKAPKVPMIVMINGGSASASEIVAGALQDHKRAIIIGTISFGKGLVQSFMEINKRAAIKLTTAKYFTPSGRSINAKGIYPDIYIEDQKVDYKDNDEGKNKIFTASSIKQYLKKYNTENQLDDDKQKDKPKLSDKYKKDYLYARAYDIMRALIISSKIKNSEINKDSNSL